MKGARALLIRHDEDAGTLVVHDIAAADAPAAGALLALGIESFREMLPDDAERHLGRLVFTLLDRHARAAIGIRDYAAEADAERARHVAELEEEAAAGDAEAQYDLSVQWRLEALRDGSRAALERAATLLAAAAARGHVDAVAELPAWPGLRRLIEHRIARGR